MAKNSRKQIDEDERRVVAELQKNANENIGEIAKKCGFSRQKAWRIIKRLEGNKTIWGYRAIVSNYKTNMNNYVLLIKAKHLPIENPVEKKLIGKDIDKMAEEMDVFVEGSYWTHGNYDVMVNFSARNIREAKKFQELYLNAFDDSISEIDLLEKIVIIKDGGFINPTLLKTKSLLKV